MQAFRNAIALMQLRCFVAEFLVNLHSPSGFVLAAAWGILRKVVEHLPAISGRLDFWWRSDEDLAISLQRGRKREKV